MTVDEKHYPLNRDNLTPPIHLQLSQKQKTFSQFLLAFLISILNFNHLPKKKKKMSLIGHMSVEIPAAKKHG